MRNQGLRRAVGNGLAQAAQRGMGTEMTHRAYGRHAEAALREMQNEVARLERLLSRFIADSDISRINAAAGAGPVAVSRETGGLLAWAAAFSARTRGLFGR